MVGHFKHSRLVFAPLSVLALLPSSLLFLPCYQVYSAGYSANANERRYYQAVFQM